MQRFISEDGVDIVERDQCQYNQETKDCDSMRKMSEWMSKSQKILHAANAQAGVASVAGVTGAFAKCEVTRWFAGRPSIFSSYVAPYSEA